MLCFYIVLHKPPNTLHLVVVPSVSRHVTPIDLPLSFLLTLSPWKSQMGWAFFILGGLLHVPPIQSLKAFNSWGVWFYREGASTSLPPPAFVRPSLFLWSTLTPSYFFLCSPHFFFPLSSFIHSLPLFDRFFPSNISVASLHSASFTLAFCLFTMFVTKFPFGKMQC